MSNLARMPPALPPDERRLQRTIKIAHVDGLSLIGLSASAALFALFRAEWQIVLIGTGVALCGGFELRAVARLRRRDGRALWILPGMQLLVLMFVLQYAWLRWHSADDGTILKLMPASVQELLDETLPREEQADLIKQAFHLVAGAIAIAAVICQGGLALWYANGRAAIRRALSASASPPPPLPPA